MHRRHNNKWIFVLCICQQPATLGSHSPSPSLRIFSTPCRSRKSRSASACFHVRIMSLAVTILKMLLLKGTLCLSARSLARAPAGVFDRWYGHGHIISNFYFISALRFTLLLSANSYACGPAAYAVVDCTLFTVLRFSTHPMCSMAAPSIAWKFITSFIVCVNVNVCVWCDATAIATHQFYWFGRVQFWHFAQTTTLRIRSSYKRFSIMSPIRCIKFGIHNRDCEGPLRECGSSMLMSNNKKIQ